MKRYERQDGRVQVHPIRGAWKAQQEARGLLGERSRGQIEIMCVVMHLLCTFERTWMAYVDFKRRGEKTQVDIEAKSLRN